MKHIALIMALTTAAALAQQPASEQPRPPRLYFTEPAPFTTAELTQRCPDKVAVVNQPGTAQNNLTLGISAGPIINWYAATLFDAATGNAVAVFRTRSRSRLVKEICQHFAPKDSKEQNSKR
jgi:hypothetical protein